MTLNVRKAEKRAKDPERYPNLHAVPTKRLATNIVGSLIMAKGNINRWGALMEKFLTDYRAEEKAVLEENKRLRAGDVERVKTLDFLERERHHALGRASTAEARIEAALAENKTRRGWLSTGCVPTAAFWRGLAEAMVRALQGEKP